MLNSFAPLKYKACFVDSRLILRIFTLLPLFLVSFMLQTVKQLLKLYAFALMHCFATNSLIKPFYCQKNPYQIRSFESKNNLYRQKANERKCKTLTRLALVLKPFLEKVPKIAHIYFLGTSLKIRSQTLIYINKKTLLK